MSRTRKVSRTSNPASKFIKFQAGSAKGYFEYYDKDLKEAKEININELELVILDRDLMCVTGFVGNEDAYCWSNEVRTIDDKITIRLQGKDGRVFLEGSYSDNKKEIKSSGASFTRSVYAMMDGELVNIHLSGRSFFKFLEAIESDRSSQESSKVVIVTDIISGKKGSIEWKEPCFAFGRDITDSEATRADELDAILQDYLDAYLEGGDKPAAKAKLDWRSYEAVKGFPLGGMSREEIEQARVDLEDDGKEDTAHYLNVVAAEKDHDAAKDAWAKIKCSKGLLGEMSHKELAEVLSALNDKAPLHKSRIFVEAALDFWAGKSSEVDDDDEIPF